MLVDEGTGGEPGDQDDGRGDDGADERDDTPPAAPRRRGARLAVRVAPAPALDRDRDRLCRRRASLARAIVGEAPTSTRQGGGPEIPR